MKKLMIAMAIAVAAATTNAAMVDWAIARQAWSDTGVAFEGAKDGKVWAFLSTDATAVNAILSAAASASALDFSSISAKSEGTFSNARGASAGGMITSDSITAGSQYGVFFVALNEDSTKYMVSEALTGTAYDASSASSSVPAAWDADHLVSAATSWTAFSGSGGGSSGTPEPTSGLLMLVGAAGLALRRRRA